MESLFQRFELILTWEFSDFENNLFNCHAHQINVKCICESTSIGMKFQASKERLEDQS